MNARTAIILDVFGMWAKECRQEFLRRFQNPTDLQHQERLLKTSLEAYYSYAEQKLFEDYDKLKELENNFMSVSREYFYYYLHLGDGLYEMQKDSYNRYAVKWEKLLAAIESSSKISQVIEKLESDFSSSQLFYEHISAVSYTDDVGSLKTIKEALIKQKTIEYENEFSESAIFEKLGRYYAKEHFRLMSPKKGRPKKHNSNLDTYRAHRFYYILEQINESLAKHDMKKTTIAEVCELTFGAKNVLEHHSSADDIKWALENYFKIANKTVRGFLNSISRGKLKLIESENWRYHSH